MSGYDIIYALQDEESDRTHGVYSLPGRFGGTVAQGLAFASHMAALLMLMAFARVVLGRAVGVGLPSRVCAVTLVLSSMPWIPLPARFFPLSAIAGIAGSLVVYG